MHKNLKSPKYHRPDLVDLPDLLDPPDREDQEDKLCNRALYHYNCSVHSTFPFKEIVLYHMLILSKMPLRIT